VHLGAGTGYYSAVLAELVGPAGRLVAIELNSELAQRARINLASHSWVEVLQGDGSTIGGPFNAIFINGGATHPRSEWLDGLAPDGRLVLPLTAYMPGMPFASGFFVRTRRSRDAYSFELISPVAMFDCEGARDEALNAKLVQLFRQGAWKRIHSLRRDTHAAEKSCLLHAAHFCFSEANVE